MADNSAQNGTDTIATDEVTTLNGGASSGVKVQRVKVMYGDDGTATDASLTNPLPIIPRVPSATALAVSAEYTYTPDASGQGRPLAQLPFIYDPVSTTLKVARGDDTAGMWTQIKAAIPAGTNLMGKVGIDQTTAGTTNAVSLAQLGATTVSTGNGVSGAGVQRVTLASDSTGTVNGPTLTKATQGSTGFSTQDLKDAGRVIVNAATAIAGVACVTTEALLALNISRDGAATASATTHAVTSGKRWRITGLIAGVRSSAATVLSGRVTLRMNPSGAATASSPIIAIASMTQQAAALAEAGDTCVINFPDGIEVSGTMQIGLTQVCSGTGGVVYASLIGYEY